MKLVKVVTRSELDIAYSAASWRLADLQDTISELRAILNRCRSSLPSNERAQFLKTLGYIAGALPTDPEALWICTVALRALVQQYERAA